MFTTEPEGVLMQGAEHLHWSVVSGDAEVVVSLEGELDLATVTPLGGLLRKIIEGGPPTVAVDLARVTFLDSTGLHCLVDAAQTAATVGRQLVVRRPSASVVRVLAICGVD